LVVTGIGNCDCGRAESSHELRQRVAVAYDQDVPILGRFTGRGSDLLESLRVKRFFMRMRLSREWLRCLLGTDVLSGQHRSDMRIFQGLCEALGTRPPSVA